MDWNERAKRARSRTGLTYQQIAERMGVSSAAVGHWFTGRNEPALEDLVELASILDVSIDALLTGAGFEEQIEGAGSDVSPVSAAGEIPVVRLDRVAAYLTDGAAAGGIEGSIPVFTQEAAKSIGVRVAGNSMTRPNQHPSFPDGTTVLMDPIATPSIGKFVIAELGSGSIVFRRWIREGDDDFLAPLNGDFPPIPFTDDVRILGVVRWMAQIEV